MLLSLGMCPPIEFLNLPGFEGGTAITTLCDVLFPFLSRNYG